MTGVSERRSLFPPDRQTQTDRPNYCNPRSRMRRGLIIALPRQANKIERR